MGIFSNLIISAKSLIRTFRISDILDIAIVSFLIYHLIKFIRESRSGQLVKGIIVILIAYFLAIQFNFRMLSTILNNFFQFSIFGLLIVFQPELRRVLEQLGRSNVLKDRKLLQYIVKEDMSDIDAQRNLIKVISNAVSELSKDKTGALIVLERKTKLGDIIDTGTIIKSQPSVTLICNIFFNKAPLHDGALIVRQGTLYAGGCILPLTKNNDLSKNLGTRHRAAVGISENSDAAAIVVSEETGNISIALNGVLKTYKDINLFEKDLNHLLINNSKI